eukprot:NODE_234_length_12000_cov_0.516343.p7 type:complete len:226 gc:universal NODE_234_length_12000_cov_0.516343:4375-5052(+)
MPFGKIDLYTPKYFYTCSLGGALCCSLTHFIVTPLDLIKCRLQVNSSRYPTLWSGFKDIIHTKQVFRGGLSTLLGYGAQGSLLFGNYEILKHYISEHVGHENAHKYRPLIYLASSFIAETIGDVALAPFEAIKVRVQTNDTFPNKLIPGLSAIYKQEGMNGFYKGFMPLWSRQVLYTMSKFVAFEKIVENIYLKLGQNKEDVSKSKQLGISFVGGYIAGGIWYSF